MKKKYTILLWVMFLFNFTTYAIPGGTTLSAGDIGVVRINERGTDGFSLITLVPLNSGTHFYITERGWGGTTLKWLTTESTCEFIAHTTYPAGTIFPFDEEVADKRSVRVTNDT